MLGHLAHQHVGEDGAAPKKGQLEKAGSVDIGRATGTWVEEPEGIHTVEPDNVLQQVVHGVAARTARNGLAMHQVPKALAWMIFLLDNISNPLQVILGKITDSTSGVLLWEGSRCNGSTCE
jgi:hypothetical protein